MKDKQYSAKVLDACCSNRMFWNEEYKNDDRVLFIDIREEPEGLCPERPNFNISPDIQADFRSLPWVPSNWYNLIVWDPPHLVLPNGQQKLTGRLHKKYGALHAETWQSDLKKGFNELWRVLKPGGTLVFKFHDMNIPHEKVLELFHVQPLFGTTTKKRNYLTARWYVFHKFDEVSG